MLEYVDTHDDDNFTRWAFSGWNFDGASRANTDHGRLYVTAEVDEDTVVSLYSDPARTALVAQGTLVGDDSGDMTLVEQNDSGLSGTVRLHSANPGNVELDVFYADDDDLTELQKGVTDFLVDGEFLGEPGFKRPLARAKRVLDLQMKENIVLGWRADSLQPLADATACYALFFIFQHLSTRDGDPAAHLSAHWRREARAALVRIRISVDGREFTPFDSRVLRA